MVNTLRKYRFVFLWLIVAGALSVNLPHMGRSLALLIIPPIQIGRANVTILPGLLILIALYKAAYEIREISSFRSILIIFCALLIAMPVIVNTMEHVFLPYYYMSNDINSFDIDNSSYGFSFSNNSKSVYLKAKIDNHSFKKRKFKISLIPPKELHGLGVPKIIDFPEEFILDSTRSKRIEVSYDLSNIKDLNFDSLASKYIFEEYRIRIYSEDDYIDIKQMR